MQWRVSARGRSSGAGATGRWSAVDVMCVQDSSRGDRIHTGFRETAIRNQLLLIPPFAQKIFNKKRRRPR